MDIVFFGTSEFAIPAFRELLNSKHKVLALVHVRRKTFRAVRALEDDYFLIERLSAAQNLQGRDT